MRTTQKRKPLSAQFCEKLIKFLGGSADPVRDLIELSENGSRTHRSLALGKEPLEVYDSLKLLMEADEPTWAKFLNQVLIHTKGAYFGPLKNLSPFEFDTIAFGWVEAGTLVAGHETRELLEESGLSLPDYTGHIAIVKKPYGYELLRW
jgi:hypothetical protein